MDTRAGPEWSAQVLGRFIALVSAARTEAVAARVAVEHAAEALDADVAAMVCSGEVIAAVGYPEGTVPGAECVRVRVGIADWLEVPGIGRCAAVAASMEYPPGATLVLARPGRGAWSPGQAALLQGMARVAGMTMQMLHVLEAEHAARETAGRLAQEQAALRRVATLVATAARPEAVFAAVAEEVAQVLPGADLALVGRYDSGQAIEFVGGWSRVGEADFVGQRVSLGGRNVATLVFERAEPARVEHLADDAAAVTAVARGSGARSSAGAPISVGGRLWGVMTVASVREKGLPEGIEHRLAGFTELVSSAIGNAQAREELRVLADEQAALQRVATLVAHGTSPQDVFAAVAEEAGQLLPADLATVTRYDPGDTVTVLGAWSSAGALPFSVGVQGSVGGENVITLVFRSGRPARIDDYRRAIGPAADAGRDWGCRAVAGVPISVEGRLWGVLTVVSIRDEPLPADTEEWLAGFTELAGTAIANAQAHLELRGYAEEQVALRRVATLIARAAPAEEVFAAVTMEIGQLFSADVTSMSRYEAGDMATAVGVWTRAGILSTVEVGDQFSLGGRNTVTLVLQTGRPARIDDYGDVSGVFADAARSWGLRSAVGVPITVEGRLWGVVTVGYARESSVPPDTETRLTAFTELVATAVANAQARLDLRSYAEEQAALRRVATLVAQGEPPAVLFAAVAKEVGALFSTDMVGILRFGPGGAATLMGRHGMQHEPGARGKLPAHTAAASVQRTGHAARVDVDGTTALGQSAVSAPIVVNGQLWGVIGVAGHERLPPDAEQRVAGFTELVATAIANAEAQSQLTASRARIVATADETRRRIERNLHDGAQQRLVTLTLQLRTAQAAVPAGLDGLAAELGRVAAGLSGTLDDLREYARRIHPAILSKRGLVPALRALVRRSPVPVALDLRAADRLPERIEITAYYVVSEALTNAAKHDNATAVRVAVEAAGGVVRLSVSDDGAGGVDPAHGSGVVSLRDRVEAAGGTLIVQSRPGEGTRLIAELPAVSGPQDPG